MPSRPRGTSLCRRGVVSRIAFLWPIGGKLGLHLIAGGVVDQDKLGATAQGRMPSTNVSAMQRDLQAVDELVGVPREAETRPGSTVCGLPTNLDPPWRAG